MATFCDCKDCKNQRRKGKILGDRRMGFWLDGQYYLGNVSAYVNFPKFMRGRGRKEKTNHTTNI